jgi:hypothetical protein
MGVIVLLLRGRWNFRCDAGKVGAGEKVTRGGGVLLSENVGNSGSGKICICLLEGCVYLFIFVVDLYGYLIRRNRKVVIDQSIDDCKKQGFKFLTSLISI